VSTVTLQGIRKQFGTTAVVHNVSLEIADGEVVALLGPSGSGKTTLLRLIAGFETADAGRITIDGQDVTKRGALERRCGMVFQHYALFPHLTVGENVAYGLATEKLGATARAARVSEVLRLVDLAGYEARPVTALSGGQQQRVALARAIAPRPKVLLLDEPLSNLDPSLRERTRREVRDLVDAIGITTVLVTHEQEEAFDFADRIALLHRGRLEQIGPPEALYAAPATPFVAGFVGRTSRLPAQAVSPEGAGLRVRAADIEWIATGDATLRGDCVLLLRPEAVRFASSGAAGKVVRRRFAGAMAYFAVELPDGHEVEVAGTPDAAHVGEAVHLEPTGVGAHAFAVEG
jgi:ABC-type Fe3+/spermidine/putrescine transport system ATPase subunit